MASSYSSSSGHSPPAHADSLAQGDGGGEGNGSSSNNGGGGEVTYARSVRVYGSLTNMPDNDYSRLSYYLKCCIVGCGIEYTIDASLLDYQNAVLQLDANGREQLYHLAHDVFRVDRLLNRMIFIDDENILMPHGVSNVFYHVATVSEFIQRSNAEQVQQQQQQQEQNEASLPSGTNTNTTTTRGGVLSQWHTRSQKVMLCSTDWLYAYYIQPISRLKDFHHPHHQQQPSLPHPPSLPTATTHLRSSSSCGTDDNKDGDEEATPYPNEVLSNTNRITPQVQVQQQPQHYHCEHCDGQRAACTCSYGCSRSLTGSHCRMIHTFPCNGAGCYKRKILGPRYKCRICPPPYYNLCRRCYHAKTKRQHHQQQHHHHLEHNSDSSVFELIPRIGSQPSHLPLSEIERTTYYEGGDGNDIRPDSVDSSSSPIVDERNIDNIIPGRSFITTDELDEENEEQYHPPVPHLSIGQTVRLVGITSFPQVIGQEAIIFEVVEDRYLVHVPCLSIMLCVQPFNMVSVRSIIL